MTVFSIKASEVDGQFDEIGVKNFGATSQFATDEEAKEWFKVRVLDLEPVTVSGFVSRPRFQLTDNGVVQVEQLFDGEPSLVGEFGHLQDTEWRRLRHFEFRVSDNGGADSTQAAFAGRLAAALKDQAKALASVRSSRK